MKIQRTCPRCNQLQTIEVDEKRYNDWKAGIIPSIQKAFPTLSANEREILMSGLCPKCWEELFPPEDDDC